MNQKTVVVVGLGKSGISALEFFTKKNDQVLAFDGKMEENDDLRSRFPQVQFHFRANPTGEEETDLVVMSPGISLELDFVRKFIRRQITVTGDVEIAYQCGQGHPIAITGTNGKTTTTTLMGDIFRACYDRVHVVGNIGNPILDQVADLQEDSYIIAELSSFQLESIVSYRPHIAAILNITEDHLNRHKTMRNYIAAKFRIAENQKETDYLVLNYDDLILRQDRPAVVSQIIWFSRKEKPARGVFVDQGKIMDNLTGEIREIMKVAEIPLPGSHNLENVLACIAMSLLAKVDIAVIRQEVMSFKGVEHRLEYVAEIDGVIYRNDSKATNPDSTIKAVEAISDPIILIAGGMDKQSDFRELIRSFEGKVKELLLLGETKDILEQTAKESGFYQIHKVADMKEAVILANTLAKKGDTVLLSPACASWDMYANYEVRGEDFKSQVRRLKGEG